MSRMPFVTACALACTTLLPGCAAGRAAEPLSTATPIKHLVVIFGENVSFDHYFGTYPHAANPPGEPSFTAVPETPPVDGLTRELLTHNPNATNPANGAAASNPFRLGHGQAATADQFHGYTREQRAYNGGKADLFPRYTGRGTPGAPGRVGTPALVMGYYDGNTVTALWNYAQHFAMSDNAYTDQYGPSTPGALNLVSGQTNGMVPVRTTSAATFVEDGQGGYTIISDINPAGDVCSDSLGDVVSMTGKNIGDLLNDAGVSWGWFEGGFDLGVTNPNGTTGCLRSTFSAVTGLKARDYIPHHQPFQYYASTANPTHARPSSVAAIGRSGDDANHQYDLHDFFDAVRAGNFPAVSFLKASAFQDGHAAYSDP
ncbi:MAG: alkaline phosphatase family protein, partial [Gemmatimonadota bacterium]